MDHTSPPPRAQIGEHAMARWKLTADHYLNVPGTEWEYKETDRTSGRQGRKIFNVPLYLEEDNIVCYGEAKQGEYTFIGEPTPDMEPLDDEAEKISAALRPKWIHPIESLSGNNYSQSLIAAFEKQMASAAAGQAVSAKGIDPDEFAKLKEQVAELAKKNAELQAEAEPKAVRRA
jgi:hypothetical protein